ncbi:MAG: BrnA antitoxin family protein [Rickettsia endosymbiont of Labidopullus appendiculatus]|nr:BrnA antitoxin family protein [Rickettsia endosymbiont of Labidopullus appendiculatus]
MKKKIKYSDGEIKEVKIINDFLPAPENLILKDNSVKVTISLSKESVDFFKSQASKHHIPYQKMIKTLLDKYVNRYM